jgi:hypothetical protein
MPRSISLVLSPFRRGAALVLFTTAVWCGGGSVARAEPPTRWCDADSTLIDAVNAGGRLLKKGGVRVKFRAFRVGGAGGTYSPPGGAKRSPQVTNRSTGADLSLLRGLLNLNETARAMDLNTLASMIPVNDLLRDVDFNQLSGRVDRTDIDNLKLNSLFPGWGLQLDGVNLSETIAGWDGMDFDATLRGRDLNAVAQSTDLNWYLAMTSIPQLLYSGPPVRSLVTKAGGTESTQKVATERFAQTLDRLSAQGPVVLGGKGILPKSRQAERCRTEYLVRMTSSSADWLQGRELPVQVVGRLRPIPRQP